jgi:uncharacterized protein YacL
MRTTEREQATLADRFFTALLSCLSTLVVGLLLSFVLIRLRSEALYYWYWQLVFIASTFAGIVGFIVGSRKMAEIFGFFFRTNKPKDGHWY